MFSNMLSDRLSDRLSNVQFLRKLRVKMRTVMDTLDRPMSIFSNISINKVFIPETNCAALYNVPLVRTRWRR